jgi:hypothetical protein
LSQKDTVPTDASRQARPGVSLAGAAVGSSSSAPTVPASVTHTVARGE